MQLRQSDIGKVRSLLSEGSDAEIKTLRFARRTAKWAPGADGKSGRGIVRVFFFWRGSDLAQPMRKRSRWLRWLASCWEVIYRTPHYEGTFKPNRVETRDRRERRKRHTRTHLRTTTTTTTTAPPSDTRLSGIYSATFFGAFGLEICGDVQRPVIVQRTGEAGCQEDLPSPQAHQRLPQPLWTGGSRRAEPGYENQAAGDFRAGPAEMEL